jgi:hypothetical protein
VITTLVTSAVIVPVLLEAVHIKPAGLALTLTA